MNSSVWSLSTEKLIEFINLECVSKDSVRLLFCNKSDRVEKWFKMLALPLSSETDESL